MTWLNTGTGAAGAGSVVGTSLALSYAGAITVGNLGLCAISYNDAAVTSPTPTVSDQLGNTWTLLESVSQNILGTDFNTCYLYKTIFTAGGTPTVTANFGSSTSGLSMVVEEYSFTPGTLTFSPVSNTGTSGNTPHETAAVPVSGVSKALIFATDQFAQYNAGTFTAGTGFVLRGISYYNVVGGFSSLATEDWLNATPSNSPVTPSISSSATNNNWQMIAVVVTSSGDNVGPSFTVSPSTDANAQSVAFTLTGANTSWLSGTTFSISGIAGASITSQSVNVGAQTGSVTVLFDHTHVGTLTFSNSTDSATATTAVTLAAPGVPATPSCFPGNTQNVLNWFAPATGGTPATYSVYRGTTPGGESGTAIATGITALTYTDTGLTNGQIYYYYIKAVNATGTSAASAEVSGTPNIGVTLAEMTQIAAVLIRSIQPPFLHENQTGLKVVNSNQLRFPLNASNATLGAALTTSFDANNLYVNLNVGDPASGT